MNILGIIPAKKKSSSIKNKNFLKIGKKKVIDFSLNILLNSRYITHRFVDTDSIEIANHAKKFGIQIPFLRDKKLAKKNSPVYKTIINSLIKLEKFYKVKFDIIVLLQPTSPLRKVMDVNKAISSFLKSNSRSLLSICEIEEPHPYKILKIKNKRVNNLINHKRKNLNRQYLPKFYKPNGAIYVVDKNYLISTKKFISEKSNFYIMPKKRSVNLDTQEDLLIFKHILKNS